MNRRQALTGLAAAAAASVLVTSERASAHDFDPFPTLIPLPDNWLPEGIAIGAHPVAYFGSRADGSIYRANLVTGKGRPLPVPGPGTPSVGLKVDNRGRLFVAGGNAGDGRVVSALTGEILASYQFTTATSFVNDVIVTPKAAYFTDSRQSALYVVRIGDDGRLAPSAETLTLSGDIVINPAVNNANGIARTPDRLALVIIQSNTGMLFRVDPSTGVTTVVDLGGESLPNGDGLLLDGETLYCVQNRLNTVAVLDLAPDGSSARVRGRVTDPNFNVPTTVASFGNRLYLPNAKFGAVPPATTFEAVAIRKP